MSSKPRAKEILIKLLSAYETLYVENGVLKTMLSTSDNPEIRDTWEATFQAVLQQPEVQETLVELRAKFDELRAQVLDAIDEETAIGVLLGIPPTGKPN